MLSSDGLSKKKMFSSDDGRAARPARHPSQIRQNRETQEHHARFSAASPRHGHGALRAEAIRRAPGTHCTRRGRIQDKNGI